MDTWTRQMGYPVISIRKDGDYYVLEQQRFLISTQPEVRDIEDSDYGYVKTYI